MENLTFMRLTFATGNIYDGKFKTSHKILINDASMASSKKQIEKYCRILKRDMNDIQSVEIIVE